jgi:hypothetical protein
MDEHAIDLVVPPQPTPTTCGPTCLYGVYDHLGEAVTHAEVIEQTHELDEGGTLAVHLGIHALARGLRVTLYSFNLELLDPTWFTRSDVDLRERLARQAGHRRDAKLREASAAYERFLGSGGRVRMAELEVGLLAGYLERDVPLLAGVSATYLYQSARELPDGSYDDLRGRPQGHFVVIAGLRNDGRAHEVLIHDPWHDHGRGTRARYWLPLRRFVHAMLLGVLTYDGTLLAIESDESA